MEGGAIWYQHWTLPQISGLYHPVFAALDLDSIAQLLFVENSLQCLQDHETGWASLRKKCVAAPVVDIITGLKDWFWSMGPCYMALCSHLQTLTTGSKAVLTTFFFRFFFLAGFASQVDFQSAGSHTIYGSTYHYPLEVQIVKQEIHSQELTIFSWMRYLWCLVKTYFKSVLSWH